MQIKLKIQRYDPQKDTEPFFKQYDVEIDRDARLLDALMKVQQYIDPTLGFRKSCAHGVCGSDAMVVNGVERLACKTLIKDIISKDGSPIKIEPLQTLPIQKDLMVDQSRFLNITARLNLILSIKIQLRKRNDFNLKRKESSSMTAQNASSVRPVIRPALLSEESIPISLDHNQSSRQSVSSMTVGIEVLKNELLRLISRTESGLVKIFINAQESVPGT